MDKSWAFHGFFAYVGNCWRISNYNFSYQLTWAEAGSAPGVGATAYEAFTVRAPVTPGTRVFINGGAGGVGTYAIQIAKALGGEVTVTCSAAKAGLVRDLGADRVVD